MQQPFKTLGTQFAKGDKYRPARWRRDEIARIEPFLWHTTIAVVAEKCVESRDRGKVKV